MLDDVDKSMIDDRFSSGLQKSVGHLLRITSRSFTRALQQKIAPHGVPIGMWYFLRVLWEEDGLTQRDVSHRVPTMESTAAIALRGMEERGFITRGRNGSDKRKINIYLTEKGRALAGLLLPIATDLNRDGLRGIDDYKIQIFWDVLQSICENLGDTPIKDCDAEIA